MIKLVYVLNDTSYFPSHRLPLAIEAMRRGWSVHLIGLNDCPEQIVNSGITYHKVNMTRSGLNPIKEIRTLLEIKNIQDEIKPDMVHLVTIKPYLYGGIASRILGIKSVVSAVAGLGILFSSDTLKNRLLRFFLYPLYLFAFGHKNQSVIFQNPDDREILSKWIKLNFDKTFLIRGSGVDLRRYSFEVEPQDNIVVSFAGRLLKDKGVLEFVEASRILKARNIKAIFRLIGEPDLGNGNSVTESQLKTWAEEGLVEYLGFCKDIPKLFEKSNIVTLPSYYGEGLPKVLIEAAACGRAVVTTDHPGCRDAIDPNISGVLIPVKNATALADAIQDLIENPCKRYEMGKSGRKLAETEFAIEKIVDAHFSIYEALLKNAGKK